MEGGREGGKEGRGGREEVVALTPFCFLSSSTGWLMCTKKNTLSEIPMLRVGETRSRWDLDPPKMGGKPNKIRGINRPSTWGFRYSFYVSTKPRMIKVHHVSTKPRTASLDTNLFMLTVGRLCWSLIARPLNKDGWNCFLGSSWSIQWIHVNFLAADSGRGVRAAGKGKQKFPHYAI